MKTFNGHGVSQEPPVLNDQMRVLVLDDLKRRLQLPEGDEGRIGADEYMAEIGYVPIAAAQPVPDGYVLVPIIPTSEMISVGRHAAPYRAVDVYKAMIAAAQQKEPT